MADILTSKSYLVNTDIGTMQVVLNEVDNYDIDDIVHDRAVSQARSIQFINIGKKVNVNQQMPPRTIKSIFYNNSEELPK